MKTAHQSGRFVIIGENIHTSRAVKREGKHIETLPDGRLVIRFTDPAGSPRLLTIPDAIRASKDAERGRIRHVRAGVIAGMSGQEPEATDGRAYLQTLAVRQIAAGADYLDLNVDEISVDDAERQAAMGWLVAAIEEVTSVPVAVDSSGTDVIRAGLEAWQGRTGRPLINSASFERLDVLDLAAAAGCPVVISAASPHGLPASADERVANASGMVSLATDRGLSLDQLYIDPLVLPAAANPEAGRACLEAIAQLRARFGEAIHITGGLSNVSFGLPNRRLVNDAFMALVVEAGADSGIIDPVTSSPEQAVAIDRASRPFLLAQDLLLGRDAYGRAYLAAWRAGLLAAT